MLHPLAPLSSGRRARRVRIAAELVTGLLLGVAGGWLAGLLRVERP